MISTYKLCVTNGLGRSSRSNSFASRMLKAFQNATVQEKQNIHFWWTSDMINKMLYLSCKWLFRLFTYFKQKLIWGFYSIFSSVYKQKCHRAKQLLWFTVFPLIEHEDVARSQKSSNLTNCVLSLRQIKHLLCCFKEFTSRLLCRANINQWHVSKMRLMFTLTAFHLTSNKLLLLHQNAWLNFIFHFAAWVLKL